jgi:hypothetical protein
VRVDLRRVDGGHLLGCRLERVPAREERVQPRSKLLRGEPPIAVAVESVERLRAPPLAGYARRAPHARAPRFQGGGVGLLRVQGGGVGLLRVREVLAQPVAHARLLTAHLVLSVAAQVRERDLFAVVSAPPPRIGR